MRNRVCRGRYGEMIFPVEDVWVGRSFGLYGEFSELETDAFKRTVKAGDVVVEAGANIGAHTVLLSQLVGDAGRVFAFEPQRLVYQTLCGNLALNSIENVFAYEMALGDVAGRMSMEAPVTSTGVNVGGGRLVEEASDGVPVRTLDSFGLERLDFLKADVEGFEGRLLSGAVETIGRCRPLLYVENDRGDRDVLIGRIRDLGYEVWWHRPPLFNPENVNRNPADVFMFRVGVDEYGIFVSENLLCAPVEREFGAVVESWESAGEYEKAG